MHFRTSPRLLDKLSRQVNLIQDAENSDLAYLVGTDAGHGIRTIVNLTPFH